MRRCRLVKKDAAGKDIEVYAGTQKTHMQRMLHHLLSQGVDARIECDAPHRRRVRVNQITGKVK